MGATDVASVEYSNRRIKIINTTQVDETRDWIVYEQYDLDDEGNIRQIKRTMNVLPGDISKEDVYVNIGGVFKNVSTESRSLTTGKKMTTESVWFPSLPLVRRIRNFSFAALILDRHSQMSLPGKVCVSAPPP
jgi:hypothetical protein